MTRRRIRPDPPRPAYSWALDDFGWLSPAGEFDDHSKFIRYYFALRETNQSPTLAIHPTSYSGLVLLAIEASFRERALRRREDYDEIEYPWETRQRVAATIRRSPKRALAIIKQVLQDLPPPPPTVQECRPAINTHRTRVVDLSERPPHD